VAPVPGDEGEWSWQPVRIYMRTGPTVRLKELITTLWGLRAPKGRSVFGKPVRGFRDILRADISIYCHARQYIEAITA